MAIKPKYGHIAITPYGHMALILCYLVSMERTIQMQQSGEEIELIEPFCEKLEQKSPKGIFSFVFFGNSFVNTKYGRISSNMLKTHTFF
jgi:hypothetical protein